MTKGGRSCTIQVNAELVEYFKAKQRDQLSNIDMRNVRLMLSPFWTSEGLFGIQSVYRSRSLEGEKPDWVRPHGMEYEKVGPDNS